MSEEFPLYKYWDEYPSRDLEYVRWYPPVLHRVDSRIILDNLAHGPAEAGFYLHVPFCQDICPYCPFNKFRMRDDRAAAFLEGAQREIDLVTSQLRRRGTRAVAGYFGGGTPTALRTADLLSLIRRCLDGFDVVPGAEISVEANPDTVDRDKLWALRDAGVNRVSFGVQSFQDRLLATLGRTHGRVGAIRAIEEAQRVGFDNLAIDLIYRVPGQSVQDWTDDLNMVLSLGIPHVSTYCLFLDPGTKLYNDTLAGNLSEYPSEADEIAMYQATQEILNPAGYHHYTINDFALPRLESEHHLINWQAPQRSYVGMGPGAFSYVEGTDAHIYCTIHSLQDYLDTATRGVLPVRLATRLDLAERQARYMVLGLRCLEVSKVGFRRLFHQEMDTVFADPLARLLEWGLVDSDAGRVRMTAKGRHYASNVLKAFYTPANHRKPQPIGVELLAGKGLSMVSVEAAAPGTSG